MKKGMISSLMAVLLLVLGLVLSSCLQLAVASIKLAGAAADAAAQESKHTSKIKNEVAITSTMTNAQKANWRTELAYKETTNKKLGTDTWGEWYIGGIPMFLTNFTTDSQYKGIAVLHFMQNNTYVCEFALVATDDQPSGEESSFTVKKLGESENVTWTIKYILSSDGSSLNITDLGGLNSPPLRTGQYINDEGHIDARNTAVEGYARLSVQNMSPKLSITMISVRGGRDKTFSQTYQVNLRPKGDGVLALGGSKDIGEFVGEYRRPVVPIGDYEITLSWSNGAQSTHKVAVSSAGAIYNITGP